MDMRKKQKTLCAVKTGNWNAGIAILSDIFSQRETQVSGRILCSAPRISFTKTIERQVMCDANLITLHISQIMAVLVVVIDSISFSDRKIHGFADMCLPYTIFQNEHKAGNLYHY